jgi:3-deoxy-D-arabino-heptulosonate 7-phosphate (DAHP) synthase class II
MIRVDAGDPEPSAMVRGMYRSSSLMNVLAFLMFGGPHIHANNLRSMALDWIVNKDLVAKYTAGMVAEWRDVALYVNPVPQAHKALMTQLLF